MAKVFAASVCREGILLPGSDVFRSSQGLCFSAVRSGAIKASNSTDVSDESFTAQQLCFPRSSEPRAPMLTQTDPSLYNMGRAQRETKVRLFFCFPGGGCVRGCAALESIHSESFQQCCHLPFWLFFVPPFHNICLSVFISHHHLPLFSVAFMS